MATLQATEMEAQTLARMMMRTQSDPTADPLTGAELGMGEAALADGQDRVSH